MKRLKGESLSRLWCGRVEQAGRLAVLLQVAVIPLIASPYHQSPYVLPKHTLAVWVALVVLLPLLLVRALLGRREVWSEFDRPVGVLALWMIFCSLFSLRLTASIHLLFLYLAAWITWKAAATFCRTRKDRSLALVIFTAGALCSSLWVWKQAGSGVRFLSGTFGNPDLVSQYLVLPFGCLLPWVFGRTLSGWRRWGTGLALLFLAVTLLRLPPVAALLGAVLAVLVVCIGFRLRGRWPLRLRKVHGTLLVIVLLLLSAGLVVHLLTREDAVEQTMEKVLGERSVRVRLELWKGSWNLIRDHWWHGVGPGNFRLVYPLYRLESEMKVFEGLTAADHAHNCYIEWVAELGLVGLVLLLWAVQRVTWRMMEMLSVAEGFPWYLGLGILAAFVATDAHSFFSSNLYQVGPVIGLGFLLGLLEATLREPWTEQERRTEASAPGELPGRAALPLQAVAGIGLLVVAAMTLLLVPVSFRPSVADILLRQAIDARNANQWNRAAALFEESLRLDPQGYGAAYYRAVLALERNQPRDMLGYADWALQNDPYSYEALFLKGLALESLGRTSEAARAYEEVLRLFPPHAAAREGLRRVSSEAQAE